MRNITVLKYNCSAQRLFSSLSYSLYFEKKLLGVYLSNILLQILVNYDHLSENRRTPV